MALIYTHTKSKVKPKQKSKQEREEYAAWCSKHGIDPTGKTRRVKSKITSVLKTVESYHRETPYIPSLNSRVTGAVTWSNEKKVYTGDKMIGIAAMHKSNLVPVFAEDAAVEISQMRRN